MHRIVVYTTHKWHCTINAFSESIAEAFRQLGHDVLLVNTDDAEEHNSAWKAICNGEISFSLGLNFIGMGRRGEFANQYITIYTGELELPHVSVFLDNPYNIYLSTVGIKADFPYKNHFMTVLDPDMIDYIKLAYPQLNKPLMFMPLGGSIPPVGGEEVFMRERPYDIAYSGNLPFSEVRRSWHDGGTSPVIAKIMDDVADLIKVMPYNLWTATKEVLTSKGMYGDEFIRGMLPYFWPLLNYVKSYRRLTAMENLIKAGYKPHVFGHSWEKTPFADKLIIHGSTDFNETLGVLSSAKIVYQDNSEYYRGAHDRVFTSMLCGAAVVSEYSTYLAQEFNDGQDIFLYDWQNTDKQLTVIDELLHDETKRLSATVKAYGRAKKHHTWENRAEQILQGLELAFGELIKNY